MMKIKDFLMDSRSALEWKPSSRLALKVSKTATSITQLLKLSPSGELLAEIPVPMRCPTMPCFGGDDLRTAYITSSGTGRLLSTTWERPGLGLHHHEAVRRRGAQ